MHPEKGEKPEIEVISTAETPETPEAQDADGEVFDKDRAMNTIKALRNDLKNVKQGQKDAEAKRTREQLSETDRLKAELVDVQAKVAAAESLAKDRELRARVVSAAAKAGFTDPDDAWRMIEFADVGDDAASVGGALSDLAKAKPYLLRQENGQQRGVKVSAGNPAKSEILTSETVKSLTPEQINARWTEIQEMFKQQR
jgi:hypothetical protein